jgi:RHS repeat-associated protein
MKPSKRTRQAILIAVAITTFLVIAGSAPAAEPAGQRYIVILKQRSGAAPDVAALGGTVEFRQEDQLVITLSPAALAALKADPKVRYIEQVGGDPAPDDAPLIGVPADPQPGAASSQARRLTPRALGNTPWSSGTYLYDGAGNIVSIGGDNYLYDGVQRLKQSSTQGTPETYTYDGFGNMKTRTNTIMPTPDPATNRYQTYGYNEIGAVTSDGSYTFTYDALGQPLSKEYGGDSTKLEYYIYTPSDERIGVQRGAWWWWSVRDESGKVLRQYKSSAMDPTQAALWVEDFVWRDGLLLGSQRPPEMGGRRHFHLDHLGTPRLITSDAGQMVSYHDYYPFGDEHSPIWQEGPSAGGFDREEPIKFTGQERDYAGGMGGEDGHAIDDMHARDYSPMVGRFFSVDPVDGSADDPQSWNRYTYARGNPMRFTDPDGRQITITVVAPAPLIQPLNPDIVNRADVLFIEHMLEWATRSAAWKASMARLRALDSQVNGSEHTMAAFLRSQGAKCGSDADCVDFIYQWGGLYDGAGELSASKALDKPAEELIRGSLKASKSYRSELAQLTYREIIKMSKKGGIEGKAAKGMKKLIEQSGRLLEKIR